MVPARSAEWRGILDSLETTRPIGATLALNDVGTFLSKRLASLAEGRMVCQKAARRGFFFNMD